MCGICGIVGDGSPDTGLVESMLSQLTHRGPDGSGYLRDHSAVLGHTRLTIIDTATGAQPLSNEDCTLWVTFNGEIFNYVELAAELRLRGHTFRTSSDTEVIVHSWEEWGPDCFNRFNGQWAIGIWDTTKKTLVLSRDRMGVRPLYYFRDDRRLIFASEIKAIFCDPSVPRELDYDGLGQVFTYWSTVAPQTAFREIFQIPPGHYAVLNGNSFEIHEYWRPHFPENGTEIEQDLDSNAEALREHLIAATRLRFERSDFPVGAYLSGGIDSSVTAAIIREFTNAPLHTFSVRFTEKEFDEGSYQSLMAERLGTSHSDVVVSARDIADVFPDVIWHAESPLLRSAPAPLFLLSRLVRRDGYKVVVTGEGADEVLGGYDTFREARVREFWLRNPESKIRGRAAELLYPWMQRNPSQAPAFARGFFGMQLEHGDPAMSHRPRWAATSSLLNLFTPELRAEMSPRFAPVESSMPPETSRWSQLSRGQWLEMATLLPGYILASQGDRMLMANSVEGRFPFLDPNVVAFANSLPARHKLFGLDEKFLLKYAFRNLVPEQILHRPKQPYRAPDAASFFSSGEPEWLVELASSSAVQSAGIFDSAQVAGLIQKARARGSRFGNTDNMRTLAVLSTQLLHHQFVAQAPSPPSAVTPPEPLNIIDLTNPT